MRRRCSSHFIAWRLVCLSPVLGGAAAAFLLPQRAVACSCDGVPADAFSQLRGICNHPCMCRPVSEMEWDDEDGDTLPQVGGLWMAAWPAGLLGITCRTAVRPNAAAVCLERGTPLKRAH